ncbi:MAG: hypothetical protein GXO83_03725 [Chlorobi bacterium]|nr:hypothetical protein [Chlorobiota bacterium]
MTDLERYIINHRDTFEQEPEKGHADRFQRKMARQQRRKLVQLMWPATKIAAVILLIIFSGMWIIDHTLKQSTVTASFIPIPEYAEAEHFYATQVNLKYNELKHIRFLGDTAQKEIMLKELTGMDSLYLELQHDLNANPGDERVLQAMIEYYQVKLDVLNNIIQQLNALQHQTKQTDHEKTNL